MLKSPMPTIRRTVTAITAMAGAMLAVESTSADLVYRIVYGGAARVVTAEPLFSPDQNLVGFLELAFATRTAHSFHAQRPTLSVGSPIPPVLNFRFSLGSFEWTSVGSHGVLGFTDLTGGEGWLALTIPTGLLSIADE